MTDDELADVLARSTDPMELARAAIQVVARRLSREVRNGEDAGAANDFKRALEELRRTEEGYLKIATTKGELIARTTAKALAGGVAARFVGALDRYETAAAKQFEIWMVDPEFQRLDSGERGNRIRAWLRENSRNCRQNTSDDLEKWIKEEEGGE